MSACVLWAGVQELAVPSVLPLLRLIAHSPSSPLSPCQGNRITYGPDSAPSCIPIAAQTTALTYTVADGDGASCEVSSSLLRAPHPSSTLPPLSAPL